MKKKDNIMTICVFTTLALMALFALGATSKFPKDFIFYTITLFISIPHFYYLNKLTIN